MDFRTGQAVTASEISLATGLLLAIAHAVAVSICLRFVRRLAPVIVHLLSAVVFGAALPAVLSIAAVRFQVATPFWTAASIFYGGVIAWLYAFSAVYKSISLGILQALHTAPEQRMTVDNVALDFALPRFAERIDLLVKGGLVTQTKNGYAITPQGLKAVHRLQLIQRVFAVSGKGFYLTS
jgi:predicted transcriptional regulator